MVATFIKLASGEFPFTETYSEKELTRKCPFIATNNWIILANWWSVKYFFAPNSSLFRKNGGGKKKKGNYEAFVFSNKRNNVTLFTYLLQDKDYKKLN